MPDICEEEAYSSEDLKFIVEHLHDEYRYGNVNLLKSYLRGQTIIMPGCFKGCFRNAGPIEIVVPFEHSVMIDHGAFDDGAQPKFILKKGMQIFKINRRFDTYFDYEYEFWPLIARKEIKDLDYSEYSEDYGVSEFKADQYYEVEIQQ